MLLKIGILLLKLLLKIALWALVAIGYAFFQSAVYYQ